MYIGYPVSLGSLSHSRGAWLSSLCFNLLVSMSCDFEFWCHLMYWKGGESIVTSITGVHFNGIFFDFHCEGNSRSPQVFSDCDCISCSVSSPRSLSMALHVSEFLQLLLLDSILRLNTIIQNKIYLLVVKYLPSPPPLKECFVCYCKGSCILSRMYFWLLALTTL